MAGATISAVAPPFMLEAEVRTAYARFALRRPAQYFFILTLTVLR
jgi:hypothetical protein